MANNRGHCVICLNPVSDAGALGCGHVLDFKCLLDALARQPDMCPVCRRSDNHPPIKLYFGNDGASAATVSDSWNIESNPVQPAPNLAPTVEYLQQQVADNTAQMRDVLNQLSGAQNDRDIAENRLRLLMKQNTELVERSTAREREITSLREVERVLMDRVARLNIQLRGQGSPATYFIRPPRGDSGDMSRQVVDVEGRRVGWVISEPRPVSVEPLNQPLSPPALHPNPSAGGEGIAPQPGPSGPPPLIRSGLFQGNMPSQSHPHSAQNHPQIPNVPAQVYLPNFYIPDAQAEAVSQERGNKRARVDSTESDGEDSFDEPGPSSE